MSTGYTYKLEQSNFDIGNWLMNDVPCAFGIAFELRDDAFKFTSPEEFQAAIEKAAHKNFDRVEERIRDALFDLEEIKKMTDQDWQDKYDKEADKEKKRVKESLEEYWRKRNGYLAALDRIRSIKVKLSTLSEGDRELSEGILNFAESQITETIDWDCKMGREPTVSSLYTDGWEPYRDVGLELAEESVVWAQKRLKEEYERQQERISGYESYARFIKIALGEEEAYV